MQNIKSYYKNAVSNAHDMVIEQYRENDRIEAKKALGGLPDIH